MLSLLDNLAGVHHRDPVAQLGHNSKVVGCDDGRHVEFAGQMPDQLEDLRLGGGV